MADDFVFKVSLHFTIEVKHIFTKEEIQVAGGIGSSIELLGKEVQCDLHDYFSPNIYHLDFPVKKTRNNKYIFDFYENSCTRFHEGEVDVWYDENGVASCSEDLNDHALEIIEKDFKKALESYGYSVLYVVAEEDNGFIEINRGIIVDPIDMAGRLKRKHSYFGNYCISKRELIRISGKKYLKNAYINQVESELRKLGYIAINMIKEKGVLGFTSFEAIKDWQIFSHWSEISEDA